jgi:DNA polymerase-2
MNEIRGWLLDIYPDRDEGIVLWIVPAQAKAKERPTPGHSRKRFYGGPRLRLTQDFPTTFYAAGSFAQLRQLWQFIQAHPVEASLCREQRRDLFSGMRDVLAIQVANPVQQAKLFRDVSGRFPALDYYDSDIPLSIRYAAATGLFPLACGRFLVDDGQRIADVEALDTPWALEGPEPELRVLTIQPDVDPEHASPRFLIVGSPAGQVRIPVQADDGTWRKLLLSMTANLKRHDPDLILTHWGDTWLFPRLLQVCEAQGFGFFNPNRDRGRQVLQRGENSYFTYGQVVYRGRQTHLFGRWHIDQRNAMMFAEYGLEGVLEQARVTGLPVQEMARKSPGAGVTAMQMQTALRQGVLVPYLKQQAESYKTVAELIRADRGGLVYQPLVGLHHNVAELDFISMYPGLMVHFNISPETVGMTSEQQILIPELDRPLDQAVEGLVPATLRPLLAKRLAIKEQMARLDKRDCRYQPLKARAAGLKWLLVVCFGYLGYKNARFGRIEAHEAVTAYSRDVLLQAKETAEDLGYRVLHMYVDALWVKGEKQTTAEAVRQLMAEISQRTGLPIALEGIYRWIVFLPSRLDQRVAVPNRYFGVFEDGSLKMRGIETKRRDTPPFIAKTQRSALEKLAALPEGQDLCAAIPSLIPIWRNSVSKLRAGQLPLADLLVSQRVSRAPGEFRTHSPAARALAQLARQGQQRRPGQRVRFIYTRGTPGVHAWDLPAPPEPAAVDTARYAELLVRAADTVLRPFGVAEAKTRSWLLSNVYQQELPFGRWVV